MSIEVCILGISIYATVTTAKAGVDALAPKQFALTTSADTLAMTAGNDEVTAAIGTLNDGDVIIDNTTTDTDVLTASFMASIAPTIKNVETVNLKWTAGADLAFDAVNTTGNTYKITGTSLAFTGNADIDELGSNDVVADSTITGTLTLQEIVDSSINAGAAATLALTLGSPATAGTKTIADITLNNDTGTATAVTNTVEKLKVTATQDLALTIATGSIVDSLEVAGAKSVTLTSDLDGETITNSLTAGTLTAKHNVAGTASFNKVQADVIEFAAAVTTATVANDQNFLVKGANAGAAIRFDAATGVTGATVNLEVQAGATAVTSLTIGTNVSTLNLDVQDVTTINDLVVASTNSTVVKGDSNLTLTDISITTSASIDASALTGKFTILDADDVVVGIIGSSTAVNDFTLGNTTSNATVITGSADDKINLSTLIAGTAKLTTGAGNDTITLDTNALTTAKLTITDSSGTSDTLKFVGGADLDASTMTKFDVTGIENIVGLNDIELAGYMLNGATYTMKGTGTGDNLIVNVVDLTGSATAVTTDLSKLTFSNILGANFATVSVVGMDDVADTITGTALNDTIEAGDGTVKDIITLGTGNDTVVIGATDSTYSSSANYMDSVTGFTAEAVSAAKGGDAINFATPGTIATASADVDVKSAITGTTGSEAVTADVVAGLLTVKGINSDQINTLTEWINVAKVVLNADATMVAGDTLAFAFNGNTYVVEPEKLKNITNYSLLSL